MKLRYLYPKLVESIPNLSNDAQRRLRWMDWYAGHGKNARLTCRHFGISPDTFYRWKNRFDPKNISSLEDDLSTRKPKSLRTMSIPQHVIDMVVSIRKNDLEKSKYEIHEELKRQNISIGTSTIQKIINTKNLTNSQHIPSKRKKYNILKLKAPKSSKYQYPDSLVQIDTKHFYLLGNKYYLFCAIDTYSRLGYVYPYSTISSTSGEKFLEIVLPTMPFKVDAIQTDNGSEYLGRFHLRCASLNIPHYFTDPRCPKQNGNVERFIQTLKYEFLNHQDDLYGNIDLVREACSVFNTKYNEHRFHMSLGYKTPKEYFEESNFNGNVVKEYVYGI